MNNCGDKRYNCGPTIPSACVPFTGKKLTFISEDTEFPCNPNINDVIFQVDKALKKLVDGNDLTGLDKGCLTFDPATITPAGLHQIEVNEICILKGIVTSLQEQINTLNIGVQEVSIILPGCLSGAAAPCASAPNRYQLIVLLNLFANKLCEFEERISNLE